MDAIVEALVEQQGELAGLLDGLSESGWQAPTRCEGWDVSDVVLHVAQSNELALGSASGRFAEVSEELTRGMGSATSIDDGAAMMVEGQRGMPPAELLARWTMGAAGLVNVLTSMDLSTRVSWVAGDLSARTLATTRLAETWIHAGDIAEALDVELVPTNRLRLISRLAWRTLPYAFASAGRTMAGPVAFQLVSPSGEAWDFLPDETAVTTIRGSAVELCAVAARRLDPSSTSLIGEGPDAAAVLALVRTYA
ncbi:MAG TPA: maleylpyruvate isomerase family mycothiol-dependent enzyme [Acidimicrobiales bacterium]|nr:maleylpyruvate isomerase family mycothiol-dependent enzyme [Acidimicrobiales bacterium]